MKTLFKWLGIGALVLAAGLGGLVIYVTRVLPKVAPADQNLKIEQTKERLERGKYLVYHVNDCFGCHSTHDATLFGMPIKPGTEFSGGAEYFDERIGLPGKIPPKNITPYNLKNYSDGELVRVLRTGVRKNGEPLFAMMPYANFAEMTQEDLFSVVAYIRTLPEIKKDIPEHQLVFPLNIIVHTMPQEAGPYPAPVDPKNSVEKGKYLVKIGGCADCHTPVDDHHAPVPGMYLAGGQHFPILNVDGDLSAVPGASVKTSNLTPDNETGLGKWSKEAFLTSFREWRGKKGEAKMVKVKYGEFNSVMPWDMYSGMTDEDLGAIYDYLRTVKPVKNQVVKFTPPKS